MPNWCENKLVITGPDVDRVLSEIRDGNVPFSFEKVLPQPEIIGMRSGESVNLAKAAAYWARGEHENANAAAGVPDEKFDSAYAKIMATTLRPSNFFFTIQPEEDLPMEFDALAILGEALLRSEHTPDDWYDWRLLNWGVKWDLDEETSLAVVSPCAAVFHFLTAWGPPDGIFAALAEKYPDHRFRLSYAEGGNYFAGILMAKDGYIIDTAVDFAQSDPAETPPESASAAAPVSADAPDEGGAAAVPLENEPEEEQEDPLDKWCEQELWNSDIPPEMVRKRRKNRKKPPRGAVPVQAYVARRKETIALELTTLSGFAASPALETTTQNV